MEDDRESRQSIERSLRSAGFDARAHTAAEQFLASADLTVPSATVIDLRLPGMTGLALCRELVARQARCAFVMIGDRPDLSSAVQAMKLGAVDFLEKPLDHRKLQDAVQEALRVAHRRQREMAEEEELAQRLAKLTCREREIFDGMAAGLITKEIAVQMGISTKTVDVHRSKIAHKLRIDSPTQVARVIALDTRRKTRLGLH